MKHTLRIDRIPTADAPNRPHDIIVFARTNYLTRLQDDIVIWSLQVSELASIATSRPSIGPPVCYIYMKNSTPDEHCMYEKHFTAEEVRTLLLEGSGELEKVYP